MKNIVLIFLFCISISTKAQTHSLKKIWETDTIVAIPESVLIDTKNNILFIALIDGSPWSEDGKGGVGKLGPGERAMILPGSQG
ncbi:MAG: hypothetical protein ABR503_04050 [Chitinophagaceae bacterium]